ncbi:MAG TPA: hypothetical protein VM598_10590 [Bdellovibrionota bacterium]|nr:hypothetical protein [Bdellovibrionota bacterium]
MSKTILVMISLVMSTVASAQEFDFNGLESSCDGAPAVEGTPAAYDLRPGYYVPGNASQFCSVYTITGRTHYPCNGNIRSFTLTCEGRQYAFTCRSGNCVTSDQVREIQVSQGCTDRAHYRSSSNQTWLYYNGPCQ